MIKNINKKIGKRIAELRRDAGITQAQLAEKIGMSSEFISRLERGVNSPSIDTVNKMSDVLKVTIRDILTIPESDDDWEIEIEALIVLLKNKKGKSIRKVFKLAEIVDE